MDPRLVAALTSCDVDAVCTFCEDEDDDARVAAMYNGAVMHAANAMTNVDLVIDVGARALEWAGRGDAVRRALAKPIAYNVASFTWPGWDDGSAIGDRHLAAGREAAALNLSLAEVLESGLANALWLVGAHQLASGDRDDAAASFRAAADVADDRATELLFGTYAEIAMGQPLSELAELGSLDDGAFYVDQLTTAARVFSRR